MSVHKLFEKANEAYVATFGDRGSLPMPPGKKLAIGKDAYLQQGLN